MKKIKFIAMALMAMTGMMLASCMGDSYADPDMVETIPAAPYGNNLLREKNVVSIAQLKSDYKTTINGGGYKLIDKPMMIKGYITGNDISGNLYQEVALQDETGAILVDINAGGLHGYLPVGQEILIDLNGLYIGSYGKQAKIGGIYTNLKTGATSVGKMDRPTWQKHFKLLDEADASNVKAEIFDLTKATDATYLEENAGKLMTIKGVKFSSANGKTVWAANDETTNQNLKEANRIKEEYLGNLLSWQSDYINDMDRLQQFVRKQAAQHKSEDWLNIPKSMDVHRKREEFNKRFDEMFLKIFPNFVSQFNQLLRENEQIVLKEGELLNTDLRIFALMRLGITHNEVIAQILDYSVNTIYTYKTKIKNRSDLSNDCFMEAVMQISSYKD